MSDIERNGSIGYRKTTLESGIRVLSESTSRVRSISLGLWIEAGSRDETDSDAGICHFIEHMVFKGTRKRRMHQIAQRMENVGGYLNAFTTKEYTCFFARSLDEHLERALDTVTDLVTGPVFPARELEKEKAVIIEEMRMYADSPEDYIFDLLESRLYDGHAMGRPVIGREESVLAFDRTRLADFVRRHYTPNRMIVTVTGNVDHEKLVRLVEKLFADVRPASNGRRRNRINGYSAGRLQERKPIQQAHLAMGTRIAGANDELRIPLAVLNTHMGGGMSSVLNQNIREKYGFCYNIYSFVNLYSDCGEFGVYLGTDAAKLDRLKKLVTRELERVAEKRIGDRRMNALRNQVKGSIMLGLESMDSRMMRLGRQELYYGCYRSMDEILTQVDAVKADVVQELAEQIIDAENFSIAELIPAS